MIPTKQLTTFAETFIFPSTTYVMTDRELDESIQGVDGMVFSVNINAIKQ